MDYLEFYGLEQEPFSSAPISRFYFNSAQHQRALVRLMYAVDTMKGLAMLIGDVGTGKTTLARRMLDNLPEEEYESALLVIIHSGITADWLLSRIARQLGVEDPAPEKLKLLNQLYSRLIELSEKGKKAVVLIDEAQMLQSREIMEEFRGILNLELNENKLITFVFFGLPELEEHLHLDEPLAQRVALKCKIDAFTYESTEGYINHRLRLAGAKTQLFPAAAIKLIHHYSRGTPRLINTICDNSLFEGYLLKKKTIEADLVQSVVTDLGLAPTPRAVRPRAQAARPGAVIHPGGPFRQPAPARPAPPAPPLAPEPEPEPVADDPGYQDPPDFQEEPPLLAEEQPAAPEEQLAFPEEPPAIPEDPPVYEAADPADIPPLEVPGVEEEGLPEGVLVEAVAEDDGEPNLSFMEEADEDVQVEAVEEEDQLIAAAEPEAQPADEYDSVFDKLTGGAPEPPAQTRSPARPRPVAQPRPQPRPQPQQEVQDDSGLDSLFDDITKK